MDSNINFCLERADNELLLSRAIYLLSGNSDFKKSNFNLPEDITFYSAVISHAYYSIFYSAKAYLISKNVSIPEQGHRSINASNPGSGIEIVSMHRLGIELSAAFGKSWGSSYFSLLFYEY